MWQMIGRRYVLARNLCAALAIALAVAACLGAPVNRVGAPTSGAVNLRLASAFGDDELLELFREVELRSGGRYRLEPHQLAPGRPDAEQAVLDEVRAERADVGAVGARAISALGVHTYEPLIAPFVVDSYELQAEVLGDQQLVDQMGSGLEEVGLVGIGIVAGPLRYLASREPMARPSDFVGKRVAISRSAVAQETFEELGATTGDVAAGQALDRFDAAESHISAISGNQHDRRNSFISADLALWPRPIVLFMTKERHEQLGAEGQTLLKDVLSAGIGDRTHRLRSLENEAIGILCRRGQNFMMSSPEDAGSMREGVDAILQRLSSETRTRPILERIQELKTSATAAAAPQCSSANQPSSSPARSTPSATEIDGRWQACPTAEDILAAGGEPEEARDNAGCTTWAFREGVFTESGQMAVGPGGSYEVDRDMITIRRANGEEFVFRWSIFRGRLTFADSGTPGGISPAPARAVPWEPAAE